MKLNRLSYIFVPVVSLFVMTGCGGSSSSDNQPASQATPDSQQIAQRDSAPIYIPIEKIHAQKVQSSATQRDISLNTFSKVIKENAERDNINNWNIFDNTPAGATMQIIHDDIHSSQVIELNGDGLKNGYALGYSFATNKGWNETKSKTIKWDMSFGEDYTFYVRVNTPKGYRYLYYTASDYNYGVLQSYDAPHYIHHGLGANSTDGTWRGVTRDLEADLKEFEPNNTISSVEGLMIRGSGRIDNITLLEAETTPVASPSEEEAKEAILTWVHNQKYGTEGRGYGTLVISDNKKRTFIDVTLCTCGSIGRPSKELILDTSDLNNITILAEVPQPRTGYGFFNNAVIIDDNSIILTAGIESSIYDYQTAKLLSTISNIGDFLLTEGNKTINRIGNKIVSIDFTDGSNPTTTTLYDGSNYTLSSDRTEVIIKDDNGNPTKNIKISSKTAVIIQDCIIRDAINGLSSLDYHFISISKDKTRAVGHLYQDNPGTPDTSTIALFDISDLNNIKKKHYAYSADYYRSTIKFSQKEDKIIVAGKKGIAIFSFSSLKQRGTIHLDDSYPFEYLTITEDYAIIKDYAINKDYSTSRTTYRIDYSDPKNITIKEIVN